MNAQQILEELQSLDTQNPGAWPVYVRIGSAVILALLLMGAGFYFLIQPKLEELDREKATEESLFSDFETKQRKVAALDAYKAQLVEMEKSFGAMLRQLPSRTEVANLLNDISQTRVASALEEELFKPQAEVPRDFYAEVPNQIVVLGTYHEMGSFVSGVAALPRIVTIDDVDIRPFTKTGQPTAADKKALKDDNSNDGGTLLRMQALAKTYRYLDDEETAAQDAKLKAAKQAAGGAK